MPALDKLRLEGRGRLTGARGNLLIAAGLLVAGSVLFLMRYSTPVPASDALIDQVQRVIAGTLSPTRCLSPTAAIGTMRSALDTAGYRDWALHAGTDVKSTACVTATIDGSTRQVILVPALRPEVRTKLQSVTEALYRRCLTKEAAIAYVDSALNAVGETDYEIRTDGPVTAPIDRKEEVFQHVDEGCWIYSGTGWTQEGRRLYYVVGK
jgi:hypothetical protein